MRAYHVVCRVHDARVDVAELLQAEELRAVLCVVEEEAGGGDDGYGSGFGVPHRLPGMHLHGLEAMRGFAHGGRLSGR